MGRTRGGEVHKLVGTDLLSSPSSSSSSDFEFTVALSPSSRRSSSKLCPADELFYKGQILPLHLSPRISMVRTLLLASASTSSSDTTTTGSRDSNGSSSSNFSADLSTLPDCESSRPSSVAEEEARRVSAGGQKKQAGSNYFQSFANRFTSVFLHRGSKKDLVMSDTVLVPPAAKKSNSSSAAKEVIKKCVKKVKPLYEKLSSLQQQRQQNQPQQQPQKKTFSFSIKREKLVGVAKKSDNSGVSGIRDLEVISSGRQSFSGNLGLPKRKQWAASCPSSMRSSPSHSGLLCVGTNGFPEPQGLSRASSTSMEELQSAIQGAIAHCKSSMAQSSVVQKRDEINRS